MVHHSKQGKAGSVWLDYCMDMYELAILSIVQCKEYIPIHCLTFSFYTVLYTHTCDHYNSYYYHWISSGHYDNFISTVWFEIFGHIVIIVCPMHSDPTTIVNLLDLLLL